jgi:hypothetical protein
VIDALSFDANIRPALRSDRLTQLAQSSIPRSRVLQIVEMLGLGADRQALGYSVSFSAARPM